MILKAGVDVNNVQPPVWYAIGVAEVIYRNQGLKLTVTSLTDSHQSKPDSLHNKGLAVDLRTRNVPLGLISIIDHTLRGILDPMGFDVILEVDHIHIEYDPKPGEIWQKTEQLIA